MHTIVVVLVSKVQTIPIIIYQYDLPAFKEKAILADEEADLPLFSFEIISSSCPTLSCSHRRNHNQCNHCHLERQEWEIASPAPMKEDISSPLVSPLHMKNQFHVLIDTDNEEDTHQIIAYSPH